MCGAECACVVRAWGGDELSDSDPGTITEERYKFALYEGEFVNGFRQGFGKAPIFVPSTASSGVTFVGTYR